MELDFVQKRAQKVVTQPIQGEQTESLYERARNELENLIRNGKPGATEAVLSAIPSLANDEEFLLELVYLEFILRQEQGVDCAAELQERFPRLGQDFIRILEVDRAINRGADTQPVNTDTNPASRSSSGLPTKLQFGPYLLLDVIGRGGMGTVYRAQQRGLNRIVAIKTLNFEGLMDPATLVRFQSESEVVAKLQHPNIVQVFEAGISNDVPYFSMEYVSGGTLAGAIQEAIVQPHIAAQLVEKLARAVGYAHSQGVIHRDLKPSNVLLAPSTGAGALNIHLPLRGLSGNSIDSIEPKIADFGLAKQLDKDPQLSRTGSVLGTPSYMAPEQIATGKNSIEPTSDIYSLGAILYHLLVGRPPFVAATALDILRKVREEDPLPLRNLDPKIPRDLDTICMTCLQKAAHRRYASANELAEDLNRFLNKRPIHARRSSWMSKTAKLARRHPALSALFAVSMLSALAMTGLWLYAEANRAKADQSSDLASRAVYAQTIRLAQFDIQQGDTQSAIRRLEDTHPGYRSFEWQLLRRQAMEPLFTKTLSQRPFSVAFSPNGKWIAAGTRAGDWGSDETGECRVWEIATGREVCRFGGHPSGVNAIGFSPDGNYIATGSVFFRSSSQTGGLKVWKVSDGQLYFSDEKADVYTLAFSPDGKTLATGGYRDGVVRIYSMHDAGEVRSGIGTTTIKPGSIIRSFKGHSAFVADVSFNPQGNLLASVGNDGRILIWSMIDGIASPKLIGENAYGSLRCVDWSKDGKELFASDHQRAIYQFSLRSDRKWIQTGLTESPGINVIRVSPDDQFLVTAAETSLPTIKDRVTNSVVGTINAYGQTTDITFDASGRRVAIASSYSVQVWDMEQCFHKPDSQSITGPDVVALDTHPFEEKVALAYKVNPRRPASVSGSPRFEIVDFSTSRKDKSFDHGSHWPTAVAFAPDGTRIVSGDESGRVRVWYSVDGTEKSNVAGHTGTVLGAVALDDQFFVTCGVDRFLRTWSLDTGEPTTNYELQDKPVRLSGSRGQPIFAVLCEDGKVKLFNGTELKSLGNVPTQSKVTNLKISSDEKWIALADETATIEIWDLTAVIRKSTSKPIWKLKGHAYGISDLTFSYDSTRLASAGKDMAVRLWDITSGRELITLLGPYKDSHLAFSPSNHSLRLWDASIKAQWQAVKRDTRSEPISDKTWHIQQLRLARRSNKGLDSIAVRNRFGEEFHLTRLMELQPDGNWQRQRGLLRQTTGDLQGSYDDLIAVHKALVPDLRTTANTIGDRFKSLIRNPTWTKDPSQAVDVLTAPVADLPLLSGLAKCALGLGRTEEYKQWCKQLERAYKSDPRIENLNTYAWIVGLAPTSDADWKQILKYFKQSRESSSQPHYLNTRALIEYRAGNYSTALKLCNQGIKKSLKTNAPYDWIIAGMCSIKLADHEQARKFMTEVQEWSSNQELLNAAKLRGLGTSEHRTIPVTILRREFDLLMQDVAGDGESAQHAN